MVHNLRKNNAFEKPFDTTSNDQEHLRSWKNEPQRSTGSKITEESMFCLKQAQKSNKMAKFPNQKSKFLYSFWI